MLLNDIFKIKGLTEQHYLIETENIYFQTHALSFLEKNANLSKLPSISFFLETEDSVTQCINQLMLIDLFQEKRLVKLHLNVRNLSAKIQMKIVSLLSQSSYLDHIVILLSTIAKGSKRGALYQWFEKESVLIQLKEPFVSNRMNWFKRLMAYYEIVCDQEVLEFISITFLNNLGVALQKIKELKEIYGMKRCTVEDLKSLLMDNSQLILFSMVDALFTGNQKMSYQYLRLARESQFDYLGFIGIVRFYLKGVLDFLELSENELTTYCQKQRIFGDRKIAYYRMRKYLSTDELKRISQYLYVIEYSVKGMLATKPYDYFWSFCMNILFLDQPTGFEGRESLLSLIADY